MVCPGPFDRGSSGRPFWKRREDELASEEIPTPPLIGRDAPLGEKTALALELEALVGAGNVSTDRAERWRAAEDMWPKAFLWEREGRGPTPPDAVVRPGSAEEVAEVVRFARRRAIPLTPYGAGSGVCGGAIAVQGGITLRLERLDRVLRIDRDQLFVEAQAGILGVDLEAALRAEGLTLGHFPSSIGCSTLGGWLAARSAGQCSSRYGKIEDMVLGLRCVLGTGEIVRPQRPASGIDWIELLLGSEGTLGIFVDARLRVWPAPRDVVPRAFRFPTLDAGLSAMQAVFRAGLRPAVARLYDPPDTLLALGLPGWSKQPLDQGDPQERRPPGPGELRPDFAGSSASERGKKPAAANAWATRPPGSGERRPGFAGASSSAPGKNQAPGTLTALLDDARRIVRDPFEAIPRVALDAVLSRAKLLNDAASLARASLLVFVHEGSFGDAESEASQARDICLAHGGVDRGEAPGGRWLRDRYTVSYKLPRIFEAGGWADTFEVATSWGRVHRLFAAVRDAVAPHALVMAHFSHAYADGCSIYFTFSGPALRPADGLASYDRAFGAALDAAVAAGATITHHHGVGLYKGPWLREELGEGGLSFLRKLEAAWDPDGILNPGKLGLSAGPEVKVSPSDAATVDQTKLTSVGELERDARPEVNVSSSNTTGVHQTKLTSVEELDEDAMWIRAFAGAKVSEVEARLRTAGLSLGSQPPSIFDGTVAHWLEGPLAGRRVEGGRLVPGVASIEAALPGGLLYDSRPAPRSAAGPAVANLILGGEGAHGSLMAATLKAEPVPGETARVHVRGASPILARLLEALTLDPCPTLEALIAGGDPMEASFSFASDTGPQRAAVGRAMAAAQALAILCSVAPGIPSPSRGWEGELPREAWSRALGLLPAGSFVTLHRIARESAIFTCDPVAGTALAGLVRPSDDEHLSLRH